MFGMHLKQPMVRSIALAAAVACTAGLASAQTPEPTYSAAVVPQPQQHPLAPAIELATKVQQNVDGNIRDYSATIEKREQIDGKLGDPEYAIIKVRQHPFSVYMSFLAPERLKGQECMYIEGQNDDKMFAHAPPGTLRGKFGTVKISPTSAGHARPTLSDHRAGHFQLDAQAN